MIRILESSTFDYFETSEAVYFINNGKHYKHLKAWDNIQSFKYHNIEISVGEYVKAYRSTN